MSKKLQCQDCGQAEYGEDLYNYDGKILCRYCIVARVYEDSTPCEYVGICNDETFPNKTEQINQLKQQLAEKDIRIEELEGQFAYECECNKQLVELQKQLEEKQNTIDEINKEFVQAVHDWKALCAEKDKEIEKLKQQYTILENENGKLTTELIMGKYKKAQKEVSFGIQLAIQELEKVKMQLKDKSKMMSNEEHCYQQKVVSWLDICNQINNQIKELKGE